MRLTRADRLASVRSGARPSDARYAHARGFDPVAPFFAIGVPLLGTALVLLFSKLVFPV